MNEENSKILEQIEKDVSVEINKMIYIEVEKQGKTSGEIIAENHTVIKELEKRLTQKAISKYPELNKEIQRIKQNKRKREITRQKKESPEYQEHQKKKAEKRQRKAVEKEKAFAEKMELRKRKKQLALEDKIKKEIEREIKRKKRRAKKKKEEEEKRKKKEEKERAIELVYEGIDFQRLFTLEIERDKAIRKELVIESRKNKVFSDDFTESKRWKYHYANEWTYEEESYLLELRKQGVPYKDIAYLLDRSVMRISYKISELKRKNLTTGGK